MSLVALRLLAPTQVGCVDVVASMERLEQELRVVRQRFGNDVENLWGSIHMVTPLLRPREATEASTEKTKEASRRSSMATAIGAACMAAR